MPMTASPKGVHHEGQGEQQRTLVHSTALDVSQPTAYDIPCRMYSFTSVYLRLASNRVLYLTRDRSLFSCLIHRAVLAQADLVTDWLPDDQSTLYPARHASTPQFLPPSRASSLRRSRARSPPRHSSHRHSAVQVLLNFSSAAPLGLAAGVPRGC